MYVFLYKVVLRRMIVAHLYDQLFGHVKQLLLNANAQLLAEFVVQLKWKILTAEIIMETSTVNPDGDTVGWDT